MSKRIVTFSLNWKFAPAGDVWVAFSRDLEIVICADSLDELKVRSTNVMDFVRDHFYENHEEADFREYLNCHDVQWQIVDASDVEEELVYDAQYAYAG